MKHRKVTLFAKRSVTTYSRNLSKINILNGISTAHTYPSSKSNIICRASNAALFGREAGSCYRLSFLSGCYMSETVKCPHCRQEVPADNLRCFYCGELLDISVGPLSFLSNRFKGLLIAAVALLMIILLLMWYF